MDVAHLLLRITGDNRDAKQALREVAVEMRRVAAERAEAHIGVKGAQEAKAELAGLERSLTLIGARNVTARVKVKIDQSRSELSRLRQELEHALSGGVGARPVAHITRDIAVLAGTVGTIGIAFGKAGAGAIRFGEGIGALLGRGLVRLGSALGSAGEGVVKLGENMAQIGGQVVEGFLGALQTAGRGAATMGQAVGQGLVAAVGALAQGIIGLIPTILMWVAAAVILLPALSAILGVLVALIGSLGAAAVGAGALAIAFGGVLLPVIGVLVFAFTRMIGAVKAVHDQQQKAKQAAQQLAQAHKQLAQDERAAADARRNVQQTLTDAYKAQRDAVDQLKSAQLAQQESVLGMADAQLRLDQARQHLRDLKDEAKQAGGVFEDMFNKLQDVDFRPSAALAARLAGTLTSASATDQSQLDIKSAMLELLHAQLGVKEAKQQNVEATHRLADAQANENKFAREGVRAYQPYVDALRQLHDVNVRIEADHARINRLRDAQNQKLKGYSQQELSFGRTVMGIWNTFKRAFQVVLAPILDGVKAWLKDLQNFMQDPIIKSGFQAIGEAIGYVFRQFGLLLRRRDVRQMFADLARDGARLTRILGGRVFTDLFLILLRIAHAAAPGLIRLFRAFAHWLDTLTASTGHTRAFGGRINGFISSFRRWIGVVRALAGLIAAFFGAGRKQGDHFADVIRRQLNLWTRVINQGGGRQKIIDWIKNSAKYIKDDLIPFLKQMYNLLKDIVGLWHDVKQLATDVKHPGKAVDEATFHEAPQKVRDAFDRWQNRIGAIDVALRNHPGDRGLLAQRRHAVEMVKHYAQLMNQQQGSYLFTPGFAWGGMVPGWGGFGDDQLRPVEGGEYVVRRSIVASIGKRALDAINAGVPLTHVAAASGGSGGGINIDKIILPPAPSGGIPDARYQAVQLARELARRGGSG